MVPVHGWFQLWGEYPLPTNQPKWNMPPPTVADATVAHATGMPAGSGRFPRPFPRHRTATLCKTPARRTPPVRPSLGFHVTARALHVPHQEGPHQDGAHQEGQGDPSHATSTLRYSA